MNQKRWLFLFMFLAMAALLAGYCFFETYWLKITRFDFVDEDVPENFVGKKIVFVSDIHQSFYFTSPRTADLAARINALEPDIVLLGGDYVDKKAKYIEPCFEQLKNIKAPLGVFAVLGNHDEEAGAYLTKKAMLKAGIKVLDNSSQWIYLGDQRLKIGGVADYLLSFPVLIPTIIDVEKSDFALLLSHNPDYSEHLDTDKVDLVLSGHTHGGQITFFSKKAFLRTENGQKYLKGWSENKFTKVFVTSGVGTAGIPFRFFARPEIVEITLKK